MECSLNEDNKYTPIAVRDRELAKWGCPHCGYRSGTTPISGRYTAIWRCGDCHKQTAALGADITVSAIACAGVYPTLQEHPRKGTPSHGRPDCRPAQGDYFSPRGIGNDQTPGCFICGGPEKVYNNISGFVRHKDAGQRVVDLFKQGAWMDLRKREPDRIQVKIGACDVHKGNLVHLESLTRNGVILAEHVQEAFRYQDIVPINERNST